MSKKQTSRRKTRGQLYREFAAERLHLCFYDIQLLILALTHCSYPSDNSKINERNNERLELLGDAVLELVVIEYLYDHYSYTEGEMSSCKSILVSAEVNAMAAEKLGLWRMMRFGGEPPSDPRTRRKIVGDCYEAVIGAIYYDHGLPAAKEFIQRNTLCYVDDALTGNLCRDSKTYLSQLCGQLKISGPIYNSDLSEDLDMINNPEGTHSCRVEIEGENYGVAYDVSVKKASFKAATAAIAHLHELHPKLEIKAFTDHCLSK